MASGAILGAAAIGAGGNILSGLLSGRATSTAAKRAADLYKRRYQITMRDMRRAGLNPILAYQQGVGQPPNVAAAQVPNYLQGVVSSAVAAGRAVNEIKLLKSQDEQSKSQAKFLDKGSLLRVEEINVARRQVEREAATTQNIKADTAQKLTRLPGMMSREALDKTKYGRFLRWIDMSMRSVLGKGGSGDMR